VLSVVAFALSMDVYESLSGGAVSEAKIVVAASEIEEPLAQRQEVRTELDVLREKMSSTQVFARMCAFIEEPLSVDPSGICSLATEVGGAVLVFTHPGLVAVVVEGEYPSVENFFRALVDFAPSTRVLYFYESFVSRAFSGFAIHKQSAASTAPGGAETFEQQVATVAKLMNAVTDVGAISGVSEEATNALFPRNEVIKTLIKSDLAMNLDDWNTLFAENAPLYTGDSDKLWPPLKV
jgi:hypothetical protein